MHRKLICGMFLAVAIFGCRTCDNPFDYCGPVVDADFHPAGFRAGSAMSTEATPYENIPTPPSRPTPPTTAPPATAPSGDLPGDNLEMPRTSTGVSFPKDDAPPTMADPETISVMRSRMRYAR